MLKCRCGWFGINLVPNRKDNTARCPKCGIIFKGISAENAIYSTDPEVEKKFFQDLGSGFAAILAAAEHQRAEP